ncbi:hypothetical protein TWF730_003221 [Orbilia blumenaviensis]|uniref:VASt domain-containing protein n=1 Tax=Orbilia blumenaviensis TaxID=1796055 RepID=A0AAV9U711_9PEZI
MSDSTASLTGSIPSITTTISSDHPSTTTNAITSSPLSRAISKARKKKSAQNLSISEPTNQSTASLSSNENGSIRSSSAVASSTTSYIEKLRKRRAERKERKELEHAGHGNGHGRKSRRNSVSGSFESEDHDHDHDHDHDDSITFEPGLVAPDPASTSLASTPTFPISISTSFEDPSLSSKSTQLQVTSDGRPIRRSTSPAHSSGSRDSSPGPVSTPTLASGIVLGNILGMKSSSNSNRHRSGSTTSNASGSGTEGSSSIIPRSVPILQPKATTAPSTAISTDAAVTITKPDTVVTPPTPIEPTAPVSAATNIISRRSRGASISKLPSKLSHSSLPEETNGVSGGGGGSSIILSGSYKPLTPTIEVPTPQPTPTVGTTTTATSNNNNNTNNNNNNNNPANGANNSSGFFSNMFSAAQTAASQLSSTIANTSLAPGAKGTKGGATAANGTITTPTIGVSDSGITTTTTITTTATNTSTSSAPGTPSKPGSEDNNNKDRKPLAVETLGQGELSLGSLGITTSDGSGRERKRRSRPSSTVGVDMPEPAVLHGLGLVGEKEEEIGQIPKSAGGFLGEKSFDTVIYERTAGAAAAAAAAAGTGTPSSAPLLDDADSVGLGRQRSDSGRSILGRHNSKKRRERGISAATQGSDSLNSTPALTARSATFAPATTRRNRDFHSLFKTVPQEDNLIEDYGCALQKEILLQGRMYVSSGHICFYSNIFGWTTTLVISFDEIVAIERRMTALVIPNGIMIQTLHAKNVFASFISRDSTYDLILGIWRTIHPNLIDTINGTRLGDKEEGVSEGAEEEDDDGSEYDEDDEYDSLGDESDLDVPSSSAAEVPVVKSVSKKASTPAVGGSGVLVTSPAAAGSAGGGGGDPGAAEGVFPGPTTHAPTVCGDESSHLDRPLCDEIIAVPLGKVFAVMYGESSQQFLTRLLSEDCKVENLSLPDAKFIENGSTDYPGKKARSFSYVKPLNASIGPKSTKCLITEVVEQEDLEKAVTVVTYTQTPDVPSGGVFKVLTRTCLMWGEGNGTRIVMNCTVEWSGKSWIKGPIEKGASDGQISYTKDLLNALRREFAPKKPTAAAASGTAAGGKGKRKRRANGDAAATATTATITTSSSSAASSAQKWGILAPVMEPVTSLLGEFGAGILVTLVVVMVAMSLSRAIFGDPSPSSNTPSAKRGLRRTEREILAEMWMREEAGLWDWLEDRAGIEGVLPFEERVGRRYDWEAAGMREGVRRQSANVDRRMAERMVDEGIRVSEERLGVLKRVNEEEKRRGRAGCGCASGGECGCVGGCRCGEKEVGCGCAGNGGCGCEKVAAGGCKCGKKDGSGGGTNSSTGCSCGGDCQCGKGDGKGCGCKATADAAAANNEKLVTQEKEKGKVPAAGIVGGCGCAKKAAAAAAAGGAGCGCKSGGLCGCKDCKCGGGGGVKAAAAAASASVVSGEKKEL